MTQLSLRSFRLVCKPDHTALAEDLLAAQGFRFTEEPFSPLARRLVHEPFPVGASIAARFGYIYVQDRSSMLPPVVLAPAAGAAVLDMCASPGSKTGFLGQMVSGADSHRGSHAGDLAGKGTGTGFVLGNEPSKSRLGTLRRNLQQLNLLCCVTTSQPGEQIPLPGAGDLLDGSPTPGNAGLPGNAVCEGWRSILLDPPCSGWGTVEKHPQAARLWQGDKVRPLIVLQQRLLAEAARLLAPGGLVSYSTCTTNIAENEEQVRYALDELGLRLVPVVAPKGFAFADPALPGMDGVLRVRTGPDGQGFFVALLQKPEAHAAPSDGNGGNGGNGRSGENEDGDGGQDGPERASSLAGGFFVRPWERDSRHVGERRRHGRGPRDKNAGPLFLARESLDGPLLDSGLIPEGDLAVYSDVIHFLPVARAGLIPERFSWKGHPVGRLGRGGEARPSMHLRCLMPDAGTAARNGAAVCDVEDVAPLLDLLSGQSMAVDAKAQELGLYFRGLPLCRLPVKGRRAVLPPL